MSKQIDFSGSVFPTDRINLCVGLTKRELFAAMAMASMIGSPDPHCCDWDPEQMALNSIMYGDALLAELAREKGK